MTTNKELAQSLRELEQKATGAPWSSKKSPFDYMAAIDRDEPHFEALTVGTDKPMKQVAIVPLDESNFDNAELIVGLRNNLPAIIEALGNAETLQQKLDAAEELAGGLGEQNIKFHASAAKVERIFEQAEYICVEEKAADSAWINVLSIAAEILGRPMPINISSANLERAKATGRAEGLAQYANLYADLCDEYAGTLESEGLASGDNLRKLAIDARVAALWQSEGSNE